MKDDIEGDDNILITDKNRSIKGSRNIFVDQGTILNGPGPIAIGHGAKAGSNSISIGTNAGSGMNPSGNALERVCSSLWRIFGLW